MSDYNSNAIEEAKPAEASVEASVVALNARIKRAKEIASKHDFKRMRENINFAAGFQWKGQEVMTAGKYVCNLTLRNVNQKVSTLYARNPVAEYVPRKRLEFSLYDGRMESITPIIEQGMATGAGMAGIPMEGVAVLMDFQQGLAKKQLIEKIGKTLEILYQWNFDEHDPDMKLQMKALVRRVVTTGVGYVRVGFERENECMVTSEGIGNAALETARRIKYDLDRLEKGEIDRDSADMETLRQLMNALGAQLSNPEDTMQVKERLVFDFVPSTSVIVDSRCSALKGFIGANEVAVEYILPIDDVNAYFECKIDASGTAVLYKENGDPCDRQEIDESTATDAKEVKRCCLFEIFNKKTQSRCFIVDGWKDYILKPEPLPQKVWGFWPLRAITFNDIETEPGLKASPYPPSDVELMRWPQKEWNRTRDDLKSHRQANIPAYFVPKHMLSEKDKDGITNAVPSQVIEYEANFPDGKSINDMVVPKMKVPIDPQVYDTTPLQQDIMFAVGAQEANLGAPNPDGTATGQQIAEQSRLTAGNSNVDDLDDLLSWMCRVGGEICFQEFSEESVKRIVGQGAVWPKTPQDREDFMNAIYLVSKAGSSGKPNQTAQVNNWRLLSPTLQAAGANPAAMVRETVKRLDDQLDPEDFFPLLPPQSMLQTSPEPQKPGDPSNPVPDQQRPGPGVLGPREEQPAFA